MLGMRVISLTIHGPRGGRTFDLDHSFVAVHGPTNTGKTSLADAISYCMGQKVRWKKAFGDFVTKCELHVRIGNSEYILHRSLGAAGADIEVTNIGHEFVASLSVKKNGDPSQPSFSDWILTELHLKQAIDPDAIRALGAERTRLTFTDLWQYLYRTQSELDRQVILHAGGRASARKALFELLFGLSSTDERLLEAKLSESRKIIREQKSTVQSVQAFFAESGTSPDQAAAEHREAERELERVTSELAPLRSHVADWEKKRTVLRNEHDGARKAWARAAAAIERQDMKPVPGTLDHSGHAPVSCPACGQGVRSGRADAGACDLCLQIKPRKTPIPTRGPVGSVNTDEEFPRASTALDQARQALQEHEANEPHDTRASIEELSNKKSAYRERLDQLTPRIEALRDLFAGADAAKAEAKQVERKLKTVRAQIVDREVTLDELEEYFYEEVKNIDLPWFVGSATLDRKSYLPLIDGQEFEQLGGGTKAAVNVAYSFALLAFSTRLTIDYGEKPLLPCFLVVDAIRKNIGANAEDKNLSDRLYQRASSAGTHLMVRGKGQVIVLDNDGPSEGVRRTGAFKEIKLSYTEPLIPGVSHSDTGEDPHV
ncbi:ATP-binding protein [Nocardiopsis xinjiangensis]|uniref:ATP-binding protein n=1 Tax=Nocardiopsis xinjiangensis TaxID=124285 RepID=UPI00034C31F0|nr:ATP-binding protein [Nocardiopsis xinjiangensis]